LVVFVGDGQRMIRITLLAAGAALLLPLLAHAQDLRSDQSYCGHLSDLYQRYLGSNERSDGTVTRRTDLEGRYAVSRCEQGDAASAIPILERKLVNNGFTLPPRV
jgi:hypothetical protein